MTTKRKKVPPELAQQPEAKALRHRLQNQRPTSETFYEQNIETLLRDQKRAQEKVNWAAEVGDKAARQSAHGTLTESPISAILDDATRLGAKHKKKDLKREEQKRAENLAKWADWQTVVDQKRKDHPKNSFSDVLRFSSDHLGVPVSTLKKRVKDPAPTRRRVGIK